jgi:hypothetical protein
MDKLISPGVRRRRRLPRPVPDPVEEAACNNVAIDRLFAGEPARSPDEDRRMRMYMRIVDLIRDLGDSR